MDLQNLNNYKKIVELYHLMNDDKELLKVFYANDYPVPFKQLTLYPVQVDLYLYFHILVECLLLPHKTSGDIKAITMSYLQYLCYLATEKNQAQYIMQLGELLLIILKKDKTYKVDGETKYTIEIEVEKGILRVEGQPFDGKDFDELKKIILEQNAIEIPDETIHPDLIKAYKEVEEYKRKQSKVKMCSFEDQINVVVAKSSYKRDEVIKMTIRSFSRLLERVDKIMHYEIMTLLSPNMDKKDQKSIEHYMASSDMSLQEKYKQALVDYDTVKKKVEG